MSSSFISGGDVRHQRVVLRHREHVEAVADDECDRLVPEDDPLALLERDVVVALHRLAVVRLGLQHVDHRRDRAAVEEGVARDRLPVDRERGGREERAVNYAPLKFGGKVVKDKSDVVVALTLALH